jgi:hypothetical protein
VVVVIEIIHRYTKAVIYRSDAETLTGADLTGADLTGAVLTDADLRGAVLTGADLTGADLTGAVLRGAVLTGAVLTGADLTDADLTGAVLRGADLTGAVLRGAVLTDADLTDADLTGADLSNASCGTALGDLLRITGSRHAIIAVDEDNISIGCLRHDLAWWREHCQSAGRAEKYSDVQIEEYRLHIEYVAQWLAARKASE